MIIDEHRHIGFADSRPERTAEGIVKELDRLDVDCAIIAPGAKRQKQMSREEEIAQTLDIYGIAQRLLESGEVTPEVERLRSISVDNSETLAASKAYPDRLYGCWFLNPWLRDEYDKGRNAIREDGFKYVKLHPPMHLFAADDAKAMGPVMELARELGVPVWLHSSEGPGAEYWRMVSLAKQFPGVDVIAGHVHCGLGEAEVIAVARATVDMKNLYIDLADTSLKAMWQSITNASPDRLMLSSDDPWGFPLDEYGLPAMMEKVETLTEGNKDLRRKITGDNAARLLKMSRG